MPKENETSQSDDIQREIVHMRNFFDLTVSDLRRTELDVAECQQAHESHVRQTRALWVIVILLSAGAAGLAWYGYSVHKQLRQHEAVLLLDRMLQSTSDNFNSRGISAEQSIQHEKSEEVSGLRSELAEIQRELAGVREENLQHTNQIGQLGQEHQSTQSRVSGLNRQLSSSQTAVSPLTSQVERKRIDFELQNGRTLQVVDGIYVTVKNTDVERQQVEGWLQIASDGRIVWLRHEAAQHSIDFSSRADSLPYQLVFTRVGQKSAAGYVLVPITTGAPAAAN
jgi:hypothetical protein